MTPTADRALVYRGPASSPGCPEAVAALLADPRFGLDVRYVGPREALRLDAATLAGACLYAHPGGGDLAPAWRRMKRHRHDLRRFVAAGGGYLGLCLGAYLAGTSPGLGLLPGDTDRYAGGRGAALRTTADTLVEIDWRGRRRTVFAQDPPVFVLERGADTDLGPGRATGVIARYPDGAPAALLARHGEGRVAVVGPHPEATDDWFDDAGLPRPPEGSALDLARDLVDAVLGGRTAAR